MAEYDSGAEQTTVVDHRQYDSFGNLTDQTGPTVDFIFGFTGRPLDKDTGLHNYRARWYDATVGRWLSEDPAGHAAGDANLYRYCGNSPVMNVDPSGLCGQSTGLGTALWNTFTSTAQSVGNAAVDTAQSLATGAMWGAANVSSVVQMGYSSFASASPAQLRNIAAQNLSNIDQNMAVDYIFDNARRDLDAYSQQAWAQFAYESAVATDRMVVNAKAAAQTSSQPVLPMLANAFRSEIDTAADWIDNMGVGTGYVPVAQTIGFGASLLRSAGDVGASLIDLPGTLVSGVRDVGTSIDYGRQYGVAVGVGRQIGLLQASEAWYGVDVRSGEHVDAISKISEASGRLASTTGTLAGGLRLASVGVRSSAAVAPSARVPGTASVDTGVYPKVPSTGTVDTLPGRVPKPSPNFKPPTNLPQAPPTQVPPGWRVRSMPQTQQYPNGYWRLEKPMPNRGWQGIDPSTMKPGSRSQAHVPWPDPNG